MRYALIADIHANLPSLVAVLAEIDAKGVDAIHHLGDLVGYAPWPDEVVGLLHERVITGVSGNYDSTVATNHDHCGCRYEDAVQAELSHRSFDWTRGNITARTRERLAALPFRIDLRPNGGHASGPRLILVHGTPTLNTVYWTEDRSDRFCRDMIAAAGARPGDAIVFGHTHMPWQREVEGVHLINAGSAGRPKDRDWRAAWVMVEAGEGRPLRAEVFRVEYDIDEAERAIFASELPNEFARQLRTGGAL